MSGHFRSRSALTDAVRSLGRNSVPADSVEVEIRDAQGRAERTVEVERDAGALRGALVGATLGGALGAVIVAFVTSGVLGDATIGLLTGRGAFGLLGTVAVTALSAAPLGAIVGTGLWSGRAHVPRHDLAGGRTAVVVVEGDALAETAREVLSAAGADRIDG